MADPFRRYGRDAELLEAILDRSGSEQGLFWDLRRIRSEVLSRAITTRSIAPIVQSHEYRAAMRRAAQRMRVAHDRIVTRAVRSALREAGVKLSDLDFADLVERISRARSRVFLKELDRVTRRNFTRLVKNAGRRYRQAPSDQLLGQLVDEMRPHLALTPKISSKIAQRVKALARTQGLSATEIDLLARRRQVTAITARATAAAQRQIAVAVNTARHETWALVINIGLVKEKVWKRWLDQGDKKVRPRHRDQTAQGWIPFEEPYPIFGVMYPPAPDFGCRCYEEIRVGGSSAGEL